MKSKLDRNRNSAAIFGLALKSHKSGEGEEKMEAEIEIVGETRPLIPPGNYKAKMLYHETAFSFGSEKVFVHCEIVDTTEYSGIRLFGPFNVNEIKGKPSKNGAFSVKPRQDLYLLLCRFYPEATRRPDRMSLSRLKNRELDVIVRTVETDYKHRKLPVYEQYSVIDNIFPKEEKSDQPSVVAGDIESQKTGTAEPMSQTRFDEFWKIYPRKVNKIEAQKLWSLNRLDKHADEILIDLIWRKKNESNWRDSGNTQYVPYPSNYLSDERWNDERQEPAKHPGELGLIDPDRLY